MFEYIHVCHMGGPPHPPSHIIQAPTRTPQLLHRILALTIQEPSWSPDMFSWTSP